MKSFRSVLEAHHQYDNIGISTEFNPVKKGDTFRVFHGFRDLIDAVMVAKHGLTGKSRANRTYSYESDNNPKGLFVTLDFKIATEFASQYADYAIVEFNCTFYDLDTPTWPGGSYTVQGQMSQYWGHGATGRAARRQAQKRNEQDMSPEKYPHIPKHVFSSDNKSLASILTNSREYQALYIGDLNPRNIIAFHVRPREDYTGPFERISRDEFIKRYEEKVKDASWDRRHAETRIFEPDEEFDGDKFKERMEKAVGKMVDDDVLEKVWKYYALSNKKHPAHAFADFMDRYLWPKQIPHAFNWLKHKYGLKEGLNEMITLSRKSNPHLDKFMDEWHSTTQEHPFNHRARIYGHAVAEINPFEGKIHIGDIMTLKPKEGHGTRLLRHLTGLADKHGVELEGSAVAYAKDKKYITSSKRLKDWYAKHGFHTKPDGDGGYHLSYKKKLHEDAPTNCVGSGAIAGTGVGPQGEPGIDKRRKKVIMTTIRRKPPK